MTSSLDMSKGAEPVRVLLVDDHTVIRQGLRVLLEGHQDIIIVGEASSGEEAVAAVGRLQPNVVLMDINMPKMNGIEATAVIKRHFPNMTIVGLSINADRGNREAMIQAGAAILFTKEASIEELYQAINHAFRAYNLGYIRRSDVMP